MAFGPYYEMVPYLADALVVLGAFVMTVGVYGAIRMPDTYAKLHSMSKAVFLGVVALFASSVVTGDPRIMDRTLGRALEKKPATEVAPRHPDDMLREASEEVDARCGRKSRPGRREARGPWQRLRRRIEGRGRTGSDRAVVGGRRLPEGR